MQSKVARWICSSYFIVLLSFFVCVIHSDENVRIVLHCISMNERSKCEFLISLAVYLLRRTIKCIYCGAKSNTHTKLLTENCFRFETMSFIITKSFRDYPSKEQCIVLDLVWRNLYLQTLFLLLSEPNKSHSYERRYWIIEFAKALRSHPSTPFSFNVFLYNFYRFL